VLPNRGNIKVQSPTDAAAGYLLANSLLENGQYEDAIRQLEDLRRRDPYDISLWFTLGQAYGGLGRLADAEACFSICVAMWPESYLGYYHRGRCRLETQQYVTALADFSEALLRKADYVPALINRAVCHRELKQLEAADADLTHAIELGADQTRVYLLRSEIRGQLGDSQAAAADHELGMRLTPNDELSWIARGLARLRQQPDQALCDFQMATQFNPRSYAAWRNIAHVYAERLNRPQDALAVLNRLLDHADHPLEDLVSRGVLSARLGQRDAALDDARQVLRRLPGAKELFQVACIYSLTSAPDNGDAQVALATLEKAIAMEPRWLAMAMKDPDLTKLRTHKRFAQKVSQLRERSEGEQIITEALKVD
jgi:tetratricopeptide (TPR) repeat protein